MQGQRKARNARALASGAIALREGESRVYAIVYQPTWSGAKLHPCSCAGDAPGGVPGVDVARVVKRRRLFGMSVPFVSGAFVRGLCGRVESCPGYAALRVTLCVSRCWVLGEGARVLLSPPLCAQKAVGGVVENVLSVMLSLLPVAKHLGLTTTGVKWGLDAMPRVVSVAGVLQAGTRVVDALLAGLKRGVAVPCPTALPPVDAAVPAPAPGPLGGVLASDPPASTSGSSAVVSSAVASPGVQFCHSCHCSLPFVVLQHDGKVRLELCVWLCCELVVWHYCAWASFVHHMTARAPHVMTPSRWALLWFHAPGTSWRMGAAVHGCRQMLVCAVMTLGWRAWPTLCTQQGNSLCKLPACVPVC